MNGATPPDGFYDDEPEADPPEVKLRTLDDLLEPAIVRAERRADGTEKPIPLPWPMVAEQFGGGLWPGVHFLVAGTGIGKTVFALQEALHAARAAFPVLYVGLELEPMQIALRLLGEQAGVSWSALYTGKAGPALIARAKEAAPHLQGLRLHVEFGRPQGWPAFELAKLVDAMRAKYPESDGPGSRPFLVVLDFLQIIGDEPDSTGRPLDLRERIGRAAYLARDVASRLNAIVLIVSSTARDKYTLLADVCSAAGLVYEEDASGRPVNRRVLKPDTLVGLGKESGEIEFSADSVSVLARVPDTLTKDGGCDVLFVTAKGRATGPSWAPLHFTGHRYREADDGGAQTLKAMRDAEEKRDAKREAKKQAKEDTKVAKIVADAAAVARYVLANPRCPLSHARVNAVGNNPRRWTPAVAKLGAALVVTSTGKSKALTVDRSALPADLAALVTLDGDLGRGHSPPIPPHRPRPRWTAWGLPWTLDSLDSPRCPTCPRSSPG